MPEEKLLREMKELAANQCAPVIFNVKPANLLIIHQRYVGTLKYLIESTGLKLCCLSHQDDVQVWFLYNEQMLKKQLTEKMNRQFIAQYGYCEEMNLHAHLALLAKRFRMYKNGALDFPHEMGIFLGYPLGDVKGFIEHQGKDYLCTGYWKVYENETKAKATFRLYQHVKKVARYMVLNGIDFGHAKRYQFVSVF